MITKTGPGGIPLLTVNEFNVLQKVGELDGTAYGRGMQKAVGDANVFSILPRLVSRGLIEKSSSTAKPRKRIYYVLTPAGEDVLKFWSDSCSRWRDLRNLVKKLSLYSCARVTCEANSPPKKDTVNDEDETADFEFIDEF